ncbi:unnamed protein product [Caenorhabditis bovis]|uniref:Ground-like domain-containing protein n=1 Tax=Caenorhabditis bovis TaxID=2654633 RepID=A0A8S1EBU8_9PELO|nr:unnamed protein product [Caenorhabditis bovis]
MQLLALFLFLIGFSSAQRSHKKQKFVRLPSGFTFPADAASNFQRDAYFPATFQPPSDRILKSPPRYLAADNGNSAPAGGRNSDFVGDGEGTRQEPTGMNYAEYKKAMQTAAPTQPPQPNDSYQVTPPPSPPPAENGPTPPAMPTEAAPSSTTTAATMGLRYTNVNDAAHQIQNKYSGLDASKQSQLKGHTFTALGGGQFYQSLLGPKNGFSLLSYFLNSGFANSGLNNGFFVPVPVVIPPPPPPPPGPKCFTNPSGFLCCNVTLEKTMEEAFISAKAEGISSCNVQKFATAVQEVTTINGNTNDNNFSKLKKKFGTTFESIAAHKDFVAKINFGGDLNCKIEIDGKFILAYATPQTEDDVNIVDANSFFSGAADKELEGVNGTKPTYIVYGPIK